MCHLTRRRGKRLFHLSGLRLVGVAADPYPRNLTFSATYNFRDVGGYAGLDGRTVRWRRLFRSDSLHRLKGADWRGVRRAGRAHGDRPAAPVRGRGARPGPRRTRAWPTATRCSSTSTGRTCRTRHDVVHERWLADRYLNFTEDGRAGLGAALSVIADPDGRAGRGALHGRQGPHRRGVRADPVAARRVRRGHRRRLRADRGRRWRR